ncbi:MAG: LytTR family DNA-binding domain-containing protein [Chitinophagaceae bacterium]
MANNLLSVLLVDDESLAISNLSSMISTYCPSLHVIGSANSVADGIIEIHRLKPDAIFLDVNMPKQNGFELLNQLVYLPSVVFVTAHEQYALRAMKVCAVDFLLKPIAIPELIQAQLKLLQIHALKPEVRKNYGLVLRNLSAIMENHGSIRKITLYGSRGYEIFEMDEILYLTGDDNYTSFHLLKHQDMLICRTLKDYEEILSPLGFMRIHKSTMVNLFHVKKILRKESLEIILTNGMQLQVSRRKTLDLLDWAKTGLMHYS